MQKLRTYITFKDKRLRVENYLHTAGYYYGRSLMTAIRIGTNKLEIEKGRWERKAPELRTCKQCSSNETEDEHHFLLRCSHTSMTYAPNYLQKFAMLLRGNGILLL